MFKLKNKCIKISAFILSLALCMAFIAPDTLHVHAAGSITLAEAREICAYEHEFYSDEEAHEFMISRILEIMNPDSNYYIEYLNGNYYTEEILLASNNTAAEKTSLFITINKPA